MVQTRKLLLIASLLGIFLPVSGFPAAGEKGPVQVHFFWAVSCPHCAEAKVFFDTLTERYPLEIHEYQIWNNRENFELLIDLYKAHGGGSVSTPTTLIGNRMWVGFSPILEKEIESAIARCATAGCPDPLAILKKPEEPAPSELTPPDGKPDSRVNLPLFGEMEAEKVSLPLLTLTLGLLDSFNPCAFFVLLFLLSLLVHARSRRMMLLVGGTFVFFSGLIYFLFMSAWLNLFLFAGELRYVTLAAGALAIIIGVVNIKDFFLFKRGISLSIPEWAKPRLFTRMRGLVQTTRVSSVLLGTAVLAIAANGYELLCTAGFPMVYTRVLTLNHLPPLLYYAFIAMYNIFYILPLLLIVGIFTVSLGARKLTEWQGRSLKLVSGMMMLLLGGILLIDPSLLNQLGTALILLLTALSISAAIIWVYQKKHREN